jgi:hypothetical protein
LSSENEPSSPLKSFISIVFTLLGFVVAVFEKFRPALEKIKESSQEVYKGEEYLARVKQSKELGIGRIIFNIN